MSAPPRPMWVVIESTDLLDMLRRCHNGADPDLVMLESYANAETANVDNTVKCGQFRAVALEVAVVLGVGVLLLWAIRP